jgi:acyl-CoA synthetase (AMP-forming)/AMP-acid ligase II
MHADLPLSSADDLDHNAFWYADTLAYVQDERQISFRQLRDRAQAIAAAIEHAGVRRQDRVGLLSMNSIEFGEIMAAAQYAGFLFAPVNWRLAPAEMLYIINDSAPRILFFEAQYLPAIEEIRAQIRSVERYVCLGGRSEWAESYEDFLAQAQGKPLSYRAREEDINCLIYTSGTTGRPKGCIWGHRELRQLVQVDAWLYGIQESDRVQIVMPQFHIGGMVIGMSAHVRGATVHLHRQFDARAVLDDIERSHISALLLAPTMVQMVLEEYERRPADVSSVHTIMYSAAPMPLPVLQRAMKLFGCGFLNLYGQSEICMFGLPPRMHRPNGSERERKWLTSVGKPYPNLEARVVDDGGNDCPPGVPGEIIARSVYMFRGYWNNHTATLETLRDGWCHTGDIGRLDEDGFLYLVDRKKDMIISGGENIYSREVENAVLQHDAVSECAVIGIPDEKWGESVCALVVLKAGRSATEAEIIEYSRTLIASYKKPKRVVFIDELPKLVTGKINKIELRQRFAN